MDSKNNFKAFNFSRPDIPLPTETRNISDVYFVDWGKNNLYPVFLLDLYGNCSPHAAIINQKCNYIIGDGLKYANGLDLDLQINPSDNVKEFVSKLIKDYLIFNAFAVKVIYNAFGEVIQYHHVPLHKLRMNNVKTKFWYCDDWFFRRKFITYDVYDSETNDNTDTKIFLYDGYFPSVNNVYPVPEYKGALKAIDTDIAISDFNLNNIKNNFSPSTIITFHNGDNLSYDEMKEKLDDIYENFKGENGRKIIVDFQTQDGKAADVQQLSAGDWDKAYLQISENNINNILIAHQVQNPALFAVQVPGKLGGASTELETSYQIFKTNYITVKRDEIESALNKLFANFKAINGKVKFADKALFPIELKDTVKLSVYTLNELRADGGKPPLEDGNRLLSEIAPPTPPAVSDISKPLPTQPQEPEEQDSDVKKKSGKSLTESDYELIKHLGVDSMEFDEVNHQEHKFDLPNTSTIQTLYKYIKRPDVDGADLIATSRGFCIKVVNANKLYSREDIQTMSTIFGYDVFTHTGGWYYDPVKDEAVNHCRHQWQQVKVKKRVQ